MQHGPWLPGVRSVENQPEKVVMLLADISGYTKFMTRKKTSLAHAQVIITELMKSIISEIHIPLRIMEIEGDAIFFVGKEEPGSFPWEQVVSSTSEKLPAFFEAFHHRLHDLQQSNMCHCDACDGVSELKLKIIAHIGEALFYDIAAFSKLSGPDVILIHRLLKNSIEANEYLLMTETSSPEFDRYHGLESVRKIEQVDDFGKIPLRIHYPPSIDPGRRKGGDPGDPVPFYRKLMQTMRIGIGGLLIRMGAKRPPKFHNLPEI